MMDDSLSIALHRQARSRGWTIAKKSGSITRVLTGEEWIVRNLTVIADGTPVPDKRVHKMSGGWTWKNES